MMNRFQYQHLEHSWLFWGGIFTLLLGLTLWPFLTNDYPGMSDYANHLARLHLLTGNALDGWQKYYSIDHALIANLALDVVAGFFVHLGLTPELALKSFAFITNVSLIVGVATISWVINKRPPWLALWVFPLAFNRYFIWGFLNYFFSIGLGLLVFALWIYSRSIAHRKKQLGCEVLVSLLLICVLLSHLMGYAITVLCIGLYELTPKVFARNQSKIIKSMLHLGVIFLPSAFVYLFLCEHASAHYPVVYQDIFQSKISGLLSPFLSYHFSKIPLFALALVVSLFVALATKESAIMKSVVRSYPNFTGMIPLALMVIFLCAPSAMMNSYFLDKRLFSVVIFLALALMVYRLNTTRMMLIVALILAAHTYKIVEINRIWVAQSRIMHGIIAALDSVKVGAKIESYNFTDDEFMPLPPIQHAISAAIYTRAAYVPTIFAKPINAESIKMNPPYDQWGYSTGTYKYTFAKLHMRNVCKESNLYAYILVTYINKTPAQAECLTPIKQGEHFVLYRVD